MRLQVNEILLLNVTRRMTIDRRHGFQHVGGRSLLCRQQKLRLSGELPASPTIPQTRFLQRK
jgi:hypothetical protein